MRALDDAVRTGKILYVGISDAPAWVVSRANTLAQWRDWTPFAGLQVPYSLLQRDIERELLPMAEAFGMSVAAWAPLASGRLAGGSRRADPTTLTPRDKAAADTVRAVADDLGATAAQVAIAWTRSRSATVHPLVGVSSAEQLTENLGALDLVLPAEAVDRLDAAVEFERGFPADFIAECEPSSFVFGDHATAVVGR
jgi:aryl-alcohol dehydrogenase-like predicted oxidoreductase